MRARPAPKFLRLARLLDDVALRRYDGQVRLQDAWRAGLEELRPHAPAEVQAAIGRAAGCGDDRVDTSWPVRDQQAWASVLEFLRVACGLTP